MKQTNSSRTLSQVQSNQQPADDQQLVTRMKVLKLSPREMEITRLLRLGLTSIQIADRLDISARTVDNHLNSVYKKAGVRNRTSLIYRLTTDHHDFH